MPDLGRFVAAQEEALAAALAELRRGRKESHWMWWIFPQLAALGRSGTAKAYGIADLGEARIYLAHPVLGPRLVEAARAMLGNAGQRPEAVLGGIDAMKLRSSMTLFDRAASDDPRFAAVLDRFFAGEPDRATLERAAGIAAYHSKASAAGVVPVSMTEGRHVSKPRGAKPGTVEIRKETVLKVRPVPEGEIAAMRRGAA